MITSLYAALLALIFASISLETIKGRKRNKISLGVGNSNEILNLVSAHSNFSAYVPMILIMMALAENSDVVPNYGLHVIGSLVIIGRICHYIAFRGTMNFKLRVIGMQLTIWPILILATINFLSFIEG